MSVTSQYYCKLASTVQVLEQGERITLSDAISKAKVEFSQPTGTVRSLLDALAVGGCTQEDLESRFVPCASFQYLCVFQYLMCSLRKRKMLSYELRNGHEILAVLAPTSEKCRPPQDPCDVDERFCVSRFAYVRWENRECLVVSPFGCGKVAVRNDVCLRVLFELRIPSSVYDLSGRVADIQPDVLAAIVGLYACAGVIIPAANHSAEDDGVLSEGGMWEFHDALFHAHTRLGYDLSAIGLRLTDGKIGDLGIEPSKVLSEDPILLDRPELHDLYRKDPPFAAVVESRRSQRDFRGRMLSAGELGEFLWRVAGVREVNYKAGVDGSVRTTTRRSYPSSGACYALEVYVLIAHCVGIRPGMYWYNSMDHVLCRVSHMGCPEREMANDAARRMGIDTEVPLLILLAAKFERIMRRYHGIAYSLLLKDVGCLMQAMYLSAAAMDLSACAIGTGNSRLFSLVIGAEECVLTTVGEFALGVAREHE